MKCGIRFCGGCNPRFNRRESLNELEARFKNIEFVNAVEGVPHDLLLVIGGCPSCCAAYEQFETNSEVMKMWEPYHVDMIEQEIKKRLK